MRTVLTVLALSLALVPAFPVIAAAPPRPAEDTERDAARKPAEMVAFGKIGVGSVVADIIPGNGYFTRVFAAAVGPKGRVVAVIPAPAEQASPGGTAAIRAMAADTDSNILVTASPADPAWAGKVDVAWTAQNYHDIHNSPAGAVAGFNKAVFGMLKHGGYYVVVDHVAATGAPADVTKTLHRIDPAVVKAEVVAAGFVFDGEDKALANPADTHAVIVFDPAIRGKTDQFAYRFRKP